MRKSLGPHSLRRDGCSWLLSFVKGVEPVQGLLDRVVVKVLLSLEYLGMTCLRYRLRPECLTPRLVKEGLVFPLCESMFRPQLEVCLQH